MGRRARMEYNFLLLMLLCINIAISVITIPVAIWAKASLSTIEKLCPKYSKRTQTYDSWLQDLDQWSALKDSRIRWATWSRRILGFQLIAGMILLVNSLPN